MWKLIMPLQDTGWSNKDNQAKIYRPSCLKHSPVLFPLSTPTAAHPTSLLSIYRCAFNSVTPERAHENEVMSANHGSVIKLDPVYKILQEFNIYAQSKICYNFILTTGNFWPCYPQMGDLAQRTRLQRYGTTLFQPLRNLLTIFLNMLYLR